MAGRIALYSAVDEELIHYEVDVAGAALARRKSVRTPANIQDAWPHPSRRYLYVATSNRGAGLKADVNHVSAWRIDPASGELAQHGEPQALPHRAVHICVDATGGYVLSAHNLPQAGITVNRINADGTLGAQVAQADGFDYGIYPHQVRITPSNRTTILVDHGNRETHGKHEEPGALRMFRFEAGQLSHPSVVAPNGGYGFGVRHLDFHPTQPWVSSRWNRRACCTCSAHGRRGAGGTTGVRARHACRPCRHQAEAGCRDDTRPSQRTRRLHRQSAPTTRSTTRAERYSAAARIPSRPSRSMRRPAAHAAPAR